MMHRIEGTNTYAMYKKDDMKPWLRTIEQPVDRKAEACGSAVGRRDEYMAKGAHRYAPGSGGLERIHAGRIDIPGNREMIPGVGFVATDSCKRAQTVAGPFRSFESALQYYKGRMADIVESYGDDLDAAGLRHMDGVIRVPDAGLDTSEGSAHMKVLGDIIHAVQQDVLDNMCLMQLPPSNDPYPIPGYNGLAAGCLDFLEPKDGGTSLEPKFSMLMVPECDLKYMALNGFGPCREGGDIMVTYAPKTLEADDARTVLKDEDELSDEREHPTWPGNPKAPEQARAKAGPARGAYAALQELIQRQDADREADCGPDFG